MQHALDRVELFLRERGVYLQIVQNLRRRTCADDDGRDCLIFEHPRKGELGQRFAALFGNVAQPVELPLQGGGEALFLQGKALLDAAVRGDAVAVAVCEKPLRERRIDDEPESVLLRTV